MLDLLELRTGDVLLLEMHGLITRSGNFLVCSTESDVEKLSSLGRRLTYKSIITGLFNGKMCEIYVFRDGSWNLSGTAGFLWGNSSEIRVLATAQEGDQC